jgi:hypothetical protein
LRRNGDDYVPLTPALSPKGRGRKPCNFYLPGSEGENLATFIFREAREKTLQLLSSWKRGRKPCNFYLPGSEGENLATFIFREVREKTLQLLSSER